tara:strand:+ start:379 stop:807 length:429 start_codon:yes stop_codon:yes gene_type:complete
MRKGKNMIENNEIITTDTEGIYMRDFADTQVPRTFELKGGVQAHTSVTFDVYQYAHNPMELYEANANQPAFDLEGYEAPYPEQALYKGIPMRVRYNPTIRNMMMTGNFRIKYRGCSKTHYGYERAQGYCLAEYADTFAIYPK